MSSIDVSSSTSRDAPEVGTIVHLVKQLMNINLRLYDHVLPNLLRVVVGFNYLFVGNH